MNRHAVPIRARLPFEAVRAFGIFGGVLATSMLGACKGAERPRPAPAAGSQTLAVSRDGVALRGVAGDGTALYAGFAAPPAGRDPARSVIEARRGGAVQWSTPLPGTVGELAVVGDTLAVTVATHGDAGTKTPVRGDPGAVVTVLDRATGVRRWTTPLESTEWVILSSLAALGPDIVVAGSFGGTLRVGATVVTSDGGSDGFVARIRADGTLGWLVRLGGPFSDAVQGVAVTAGDPKAARIAIAGTFSLGAELRGVALASTDERSPFPDVFVAELDGAGTRRWSSTFGSRVADAVAGVALDDEGRVIVAANVHEVLSIGGVALAPRGASDGLVVWYGDGGELGHAGLIGGNELDGIRAITTVHGHAIIAGVFSGSIALGDQTLAAGGGDDAFVAAIDPSGTLTTSWHISGTGREEITSLAAVAGGFVTGLAHTAAVAVDGESLAAPPAGVTGAALVVRGLP